MRTQAYSDQRAAVVSKDDADKEELKKRFWLGKRAVYGLLILFALVIIAETVKENSAVWVVDSTAILAHDIFYAVGDVLFVIQREGWILLSKLGDVFQNLWRYIKEVCQIVYDFFVRAVQFIWEELVLRLLQTTWRFLKTVFRNLCEFLQNLWEHLQTVLNSFMHALVRTFGSSLKVLASPFGFLEGYLFNLWDWCISLGKEYSFVFFLSIGITVLVTGIGYYAYTRKFWRPSRSPCRNQQ